MADRIAILGAGSWGTALAVHCGRVGHHVRLWGREPDAVAGILRVRENPRYLAGFRLDENVHPTSSLAEALEGAGIVVAAVPSHGMRAVVRAASPWMGSARVIVSAAKGLETDSLARMSQVLESEAGSSLPIVVLSGPSFAIEVAKGLPTVVVAASKHHEAANWVQDAFKGPAFRLYASDDVIGVEMGGAMKNVIAIAAGVVEGLGLGHNALAALMTRGLAEMSRLACAEGARRDTLSGLSGLGDLVLTCTGDLSRNRTVGIELGRGRTIEEILSGMYMVAEGVRTTRAVLALGARHDVELPIAAEMAAVLEGTRSPAEAVEALMLRRQRRERDH